MRDIALITTATYGLEAMQQTLPRDVSSFIDQDEQRLVLQDDNIDNFIEIARDDSIGDYYETPAELAALEKLPGTPRYYLVHFKNIERLKRVLREIAIRDDVIVDNDFGMLEPGAEYVRRCAASPGWDCAKPA